MRMKGREKNAQERIGNIKITTENGNGSTWCQNLTIRHILSKKIVHILKPKVMLIDEKLIHRIPPEKQQKTSCQLCTQQDLETHSSRTQHLHQLLQIKH
ncbi:hypothetical protein Leryth_006225 [Lithospermum erythrorhizon]|nr:hypothetical protein Leryth_006225 [Lithospermum erythrorhizon]